MKFSKLLELVDDEPVFETGDLYGADTPPKALAVQLSRWRSTGKLIQLRRGLYALAPPYRKTNPSPFLIANRLAPGSYVSTHMALAYAAVIPEYVSTATSCGSGRPRTWNTPLGRFIFQYLCPDMLHLFAPPAMGYRQVEIQRGQHAWVATPEKALLDLVHLTAEADDPRWLEEMRLNYECISVAHLAALAKASQRPKLVRAAEYVARAAQEESWM